MNRCKFGEKYMIKYEIVEEYLQNFNKEATIVTYRKCIERYFKFFNIEPTEYLKHKRNVDKDIEKYNQSFKDIPPHSQKLYISAIKKFLEHHDIDIKKKTLDNIKNRGPRRTTRTEDRIPTNKELKQILTHGELLDKSFFTLLATTGMRINEAVNIEWDDIDVEKRKITIRASISKNDLTRVVFFTEETKEFLLEWKKEGTRFFDRAKTSSEKFGNSKNNKHCVFPLSTCYMQHRWVNLIHRAGHPLNMKDRETGRYVLHPHSLRKFFDTQLSSAGLSEAIVQKLMGHIGYLNGSYVKLTEQKLKEKYDQFSVCLSVFSDLEIIQPQIKEQDKKLSILREENDLLKLKILRLEEKEKNLDALVLQKVQEVMSQVGNYTK
jgi:integrase